MDTNNVYIVLQQLDIVSRQRWNFDHMLLQVFPLWQRKLAQNEGMK